MLESNCIKVGSPLIMQKSTSFDPTLGFERSPSTITPKPHQRDTPSDRFIPSKITANLYDIYFSDDVGADQRSGSSNAQSLSGRGNQTASERNKEEHNSVLYSQLLKSQILGEITQNYNDNIPKDVNRPQGTQLFPQEKMKKIFKFGSEKKTTNNENFPVYSPLYMSTESLFYNSMEKTSRKISKHPYKVLDAPGLQDDFYLNLVDWSCHNVISIGLENDVFIWSATSGKNQKIGELPTNDSVCSVGWSHNGNHLAIGNSFGEVKIYDVTKNKLLRKIKGHEGRVGSLTWNGYLLATGSRDKNILIRDVRSPESFLHTFTGHKQEICGLRWSFDENLLASGGNDNKVFIWSLRQGGELVKFSQHNAAVKALGWSPHQNNVLASGGGTADRCIRFWDTQSLSLLDYIDTGSQVCNLMFSKNSNEIVSTHGYSLNQINVWKYPTKQKVATLTGHTYRVLYLSMSPCGQNIVTGAGDETLRFWNMFPSNKNKYSLLDSKNSLSHNCVDLR